MPRFLLPLMLAVLGAALAAWLVPQEQALVREQLVVFPDADAATQKLRPLILGLLCALPFAGGLLYAMGGTIARYVTRQFLTLLFIVFFGLATLWLLLDFQDNLEELKQSRDIAGTAAQLYAARFPEIVVTLLPYALLLSLIFCLGRLSSSREIVAMIQTGRGLMRLTAPFLATGLLSALLCAGLNYQWAPRATAEEKYILDHARGLDTAVVEGVVHFRNPRIRRHWWVARFPPGYQDGGELRGVRIVEENRDGTLKRILTASSAKWERATGAWYFGGAVIRTISPGEAPEFLPDLPDPYVVRAWRETPYEIIQPGLPPAQRGIPGLTSWLKAHPPGGREPRQVHLTQWHHRWAQPFNCIIFVLLATPLGIVFTRRGATGGVAITVFLAVGLLFLTNLSLTLGDAGHLPPILAAWLPNIAFGLLAFYLVRRRLAGRPIYQNLRSFLPNSA